MTINDKIQKIIYLCDVHHINSVSLAKGTGLSQSGLNRLLKGKIKNPRKDTLNKSLKFLENITGSSRVTDKKQNDTEMAKQILDNISSEQILDYLIENENRFLEAENFKYFVTLINKNIKIINLERELKKSTHNSDSGIK